MKNLLHAHTLAGCFLWLLPVLCISTARAAIVATFPANPELVTIATGPPSADLASVDFNNDGNPEFWMNSGGIYLMLAPPNRVFILQSPPPNHGGLVGNLPLDFSIYRDSSRPNYGWYEGFPLPGVSEGYGLPVVANGVDFGSCRDDGCVSLFLQRSGYIGIEMQLNGSTHYGWVHINNRDANGNDLGIGGYLDAWAYETEAGIPIAAGAVPEPAMLTLVSAAVLLGLYRRMR